MPSSHYEFGQFRRPCVCSDDFRFGYPIQIHRTELLEGP